MGAAVSEISQMLRDFIREPKRSDETLTETTAKFLGVVVGAVIELDERLDRLEAATTE
ncbi:hypothetical protein BH24ACT3_BH24ACT3_02990 [soil metagenome]